MSKRNTVTVLTVVCLLAVPPLLLLPATGWAQLEEVVVTTRRRTESLQDVPISIRAITADEIQRIGITDLTDITKLTPSVTFDSGYNPTDTRVNIRGLSATRGRANVAFLIDGIDVTSENVIAAGSGLLANQRLLNDVERIEIVKGSQSALFGRAAFAGAISYTTKEPGDEFEGNVSLDASEYGYFQVGAAAGGPIFGDVFGLRLNGVYWEDDGVFTNSVSGKKVGGGDGFGTSLTAVLTPTDALKFKARVEYSDDHFDPQATVRFPQLAPVPYPETTITRLNTQNPDGSVKDITDLAIANGYSTTTAGMPDHGLYCFDALPSNLKEYDERQLALKEIYPNYPTMPAHVADPNNPHPDDDVNWKQALSDGSDPLVPGFCMTANVGGESGKVITHSEDPATGADYEGTDTDLFRVSLLATWDLSFGSFTSNTGYTDAEGTVHQDQEYQARSRPDNLLQAQGAFATNNTEQFSQELRFSSNFDGPIQFTLGGLYWNEERASDDNNFIIDCFTTGQHPAFGLTTDVSGLCDGTNGSVDNWQDFWRQLQPRPKVPIWLTETEHLSAYVMFEWSLTDQWKVTFEDRYVDETFDLTKPNASGCTTFGLSIGAGVIARVPLLNEQENPDLLIACTADYFDRSTGPIRIEDLPEDLQAFYQPHTAGATNVTCVKSSGVTVPGFPLDGYGDPIDGDNLLNPDGNLQPAGTDAGGCPAGTITGSQDSQYHVPKVTVEWNPTDDSMVYFFWAKAIKPAGINQLSTGGAASTIDEERFDAEKMDTYEIGTKTAWEAAGYLQLNGAVFFLDYTDKQVGTQILVPDGVGGFRSNPRVINASSAAVWGLELEAVWQPSFLEGLSLSAAYTYLDTEYTDFIDETTTFTRAGVAGECPIVWKDENDNTVATGTVNPNTDPDNPTFAPKCALNLSGNKLERSPEHAFVGRFNLTRPFGSGGLDWFTEFDAIYQSERFADQDNFTQYDEFWQVDARLGLAGDSMSVVFFVDNLLDDDTIRGGGSGPDFGGRISDMGFSAGLVRTHFFGPLTQPRTFGARLLYRF
jgi:outer membrane receptor protein involved in Fe transport